MSEVVSPFALVMHHKPILSRPIRHRPVSRRPISVLADDVGAWGRGQLASGGLCAGEMTVNPSGRLMGVWRVSQDEWRGPAPVVPHQGHPGTGGRGRGCGDGCWGGDGWRQRCRYVPVSCCYLSPRFSKGLFYCRSGFVLNCLSNCYIYFKKSTKNRFIHTVW